MKKIWGPIVLSVALLTSSCAKRSAPGDTADAANGKVDVAETSDDFQLEDSKMESTAQNDPAPAETAVEEVKNEPVAEETMAAATVASTPKIEMTDENRTYMTSKGDTLMLIAFKIYGDYSRWHEIKKMNSKVLAKHKGPLKAGLALKYKAPSEDFIQQANGEPYLIKFKDTLGKISKKVYKTPKRWKEIWKNNAYIVNPNVIFAGFTLFYVKDEKKLAKNN